MKYTTLYFFISLLLLQACKTTQPNKETKQESTILVKDDGCPENGVCSYQIEKDKEIDLHKDGIGSLYARMVEGKSWVVTYTCSVKGPEGTKDGNYTENIYFEIPAETIKLTRKNEHLEELNLLFEKQCYCKGEAGFYKITQGVLKVEKTARELLFALDFSVDETSHQLSSISGTVEL